MMKETKEALVGVNELSIAIIEAIKKHGTAAEDAMALWVKFQTDEAFKTKMVNAFTGITSVPAEFKALTLADSLELVSTEVAYVPQILNALSGGVPATTGSIGIENVKELLSALNELSIFFIGRFKDGVQLADFVALWTKLEADPEFKSHLTKTIANISKIGSEVGDLTMLEGMDLLTTQINYIPMIVDALKK